MAKFWIRKGKKTHFSATSHDFDVRDNVEAETPEEAIYKAFGVKVVESGVHPLGIATQSSDDNGNRYWRIKE